MSSLTRRRSWCRKKCDVEPHSTQECKGLMSISLMYLVREIRNRSPRSLSAFHVASEWIRWTVRGRIARTYARSYENPAIFSRSATSTGYSTALPQLFRVPRLSINNLTLAREDPRSNFLDTWAQTDSLRYARPFPPLLLAIGSWKMVFTLQ